MRGTRRITGCALLGLLPFALVVAVFDPWPALDGMNAARALAKARGYDVSDGGFADFVTQPDDWGGCEIEAAFAGKSAQEVVVRVRRSWRWGTWKLVGISTHDFPAPP